ncbi:MAG: LamG-like jellyroll fold domain-containing protein [Candidatus Binatia bacterium]
MGTIAFDIEPHWDGDQTNNSLLQIRDEHQWENALAIVKNYNSLRFIIIDESGVETNVNVYIDDWRAGDAHRVAASWGEALMALYVDGVQVGQATLPHELAFGDATAPIHVGSDYSGSQYRSANGRISNLTVYGRPSPRARSARPPPARGVRASSALHCRNRLARAHSPRAAPFRGSDRTPAVRGRGRATKRRAAARPGRCCPSDRQQSRTVRSAATRDRSSPGGY